MPNVLANFFSAVVVKEDPWREREGKPVNEQGWL